jgi:hypothetical protein
VVGCPVIKVEDPRSVPCLTRLGLCGAGQIAFWRGEPPGPGNTYVLCLESGIRPSQCVIATVQLVSGRLNCLRMPEGSDAQLGSGGANGDVTAWLTVLRSSGFARLSRPRPGREKFTNDQKW